MAPDREWRKARRALVDRLVERGYCDRDSTREAMLAVPRHQFVPAERRDHAYEDRPLSIGDGQTISAPHMVAMMVDRLTLEPGDRVLEIGTGCGYHAAVVAEVVGAEQVYTVEVSATLATRARRTLERTGYRGIHQLIGDGRRGWPEAAPFEAAYSTCALETVPEPLYGQVRAGGRIVAPIGTHRQELVIDTVGADGRRDRERHGGVRFVHARSDDS